MPCPFSSCCCTSKICFTGYGQCPATHPLAGISVVLKDPGGTQVGATQTTDSLGTKLCWDIGTGTGTYSIVATWTNGVAQTIPVNVTTCAEYDTSASWLDKTCVTVTGCAGTIMDATVTICGNNAAYDAGSGSYCFTWSSVAPPTTACAFVVTLATGPTRTVSQIPGCTASFAFIDQVCVFVGGCNGGAVSGATVTVTDGGTTIGSGTSDSGGNFCFNPSTDISGHTLSYTAVKSPRFASTSVSGAAACTATVNMTAASGYTCCFGMCNDPIKLALTITDGNGAHTVTGVCSGSPGSYSIVWKLCYTTPAIANTYYNDFAGCGGTTAATTVGYVLTLVPGGDWQLNQYWGWQTCTGTDYHYATQGVGCNSTTGVLTVASPATQDFVGISFSDCSVPTALSGTWPAMGLYMAPPVTGSVTVSE